MSKKRSFWKSSLLITPLLLLTSCSILPKEESVLAPPLIEPAKIEYKTAKATKGKIVKRVQGMGSLVPSGSHNLYYRESGGRIEKVYVAEGDLVKKGQTLVDLETGNLVFDIQQAQLELEKANVEIKQLVAQGADTYSIEKAKLDVEITKVRLQKLQNLQANSKIISPINGVVSYLSDLKPGDQVEAYQSIVQVADTTNLQLKYTASSANELTDVKIGMPVHVSLNGQTLDGKVVQTPNEVPADALKQNTEDNQRSILVRIEHLPNQVKVGDSLSFEIITYQKENALIIPKSGLRTGIGRNYVQVLDGKTKREMDIELGLISATEVEITKGLNVGDEVILK
ncbi:efflux RND transporter periplasmic adaptor subunit [Neobacillus cucumis]|nr:efflux RND transporter periplasmic adaptor subunit [Neobacillus cucumis]